MELVVREFSHQFSGAINKTDKPLWPDVAHGRRSGLFMFINLEIWRSFGARNLLWISTDAVPSCGGGACV